jgi:hypothetical protein
LTSAILGLAFGGPLKGIDHVFFSHS